MENQRHYFWVYQWNTKKFSEGISNPCFLCEIDNDSLRIHDTQKPVFIAWSQIATCDMELNIGSHPSISQFVRLKIKDEALIQNLNNAKVIYLVPMDTLRARFWHDSHEAAINYNNRALHIHL